MAISAPPHRCEVAKESAQCHFVISASIARPSLFERYQVRDTTHKSVGNVRFVYEDMD